jgi:hypothetical protein
MKWMSDARGRRWLRAFEMFFGGRAGRGVDGENRGERKRLLLTQGQRT